jgi:hypothetical protein
VAAADRLIRLLPGGRRLGVRYLVELFSGAELLQFLADFELPGLSAVLQNPDFFSPVIEF